jgi:hypothetical protein
MVSVFASSSVDLGFEPGRVKIKTLKLELKDQEQRLESG